MCTLYIHVLAVFHTESCLGDYKHGNPNHWGGGNNIYYRVHDAGGGGLGLEVHTCNKYPCIQAWEPNTTGEGKIIHTVSAMMLERGGGGFGWR